MASYTLKKNPANKNNHGGMRSTDKIKYIVIHYTANDGDTDENNGKYFANNVVKASAHYFVDDDSVTQSVADYYTAWSVGGKKYGNCNATGGGKCYGACTNTNSISVELCDDVKNGVVYPSKATIENALALTRDLMKKYNIPASNVIRHFDVTGKSCPAYWCGNAEKNAKWLSEFWNRLSETPTATTKPTTAQTTATAVPFLFKVANVSKGDVLNVRRSPSATAVKTGSIAYNDNRTYTIVEVKNGWGRLKSGIGWVNLKYTKTVEATKTNPYYAKYTGTSNGIDTVFRAIGVPEKFLGSAAKRKPVATVNGLSSKYKGSYADNMYLIKLAKQGVLKRV